MNKIQIDINDFYQNYDNSDITKVNNIIKDLKPFLENSDIEGAFNFLNNDDYKKYPEIQYYKVNLLIRMGKLQLAYSIVNRNINFKPFIQIKKQLEIVMQRQNKKIKDEINSIKYIFNEIYPDLSNEHIDDTLKLYKLEEITKLKNIIIEFYRYYKSGDIDNSLKVISDVNYNKYVLIQYCRVMILRSQKQLKKAYNIASKYPSFTPLIQEKKQLEIKIQRQKQKINDEINGIKNILNEIYPDLNNEYIDDALKLYELDEITKLKNIIIEFYRYYKSGDIDNSLKIISDVNYNNYVLIQYCRVMILRSQKQLQKASNIASKYPKFIPLKDLSVILEEELKKQEETNKELNDSKVNKELNDSKVNKELNDSKNNNREPNREASILITKLYLNELSLDEVNNSNLKPFEKVIITIAYYSKFNNKKALEYLKGQKIVYKDDIEKIKILNYLMEDLLRGKFYFDIFLYYLNAKILYDEIGSIKKDEKKEGKKVDPRQNIKEKIKQKELEQKELKETKKDKKIVIYQKKIINTPQNVVLTKPKKVEEKVKTHNIITIKHAMYETVFEIQKILYVLMQDSKTQKNASKAWDNFEVLVNKPITDEESLTRFINIAKKINLNSQYNPNEYIKNLK